MELVYLLFCFQENAPRLPGGGAASASIDKALEATSQSEAPDLHHVEEEEEDAE